MSRRTLPPRNTLVILDEVAQLENFEFLQTMLTLCRGYGLQVMTIWQDLDQIRSCFNSYKTILNNCGVLSVFGITNYRAAEEWAELLGVSPDSLMNLKPDEQMLLIRGECARRAGRCNYLTDDMFQGLSDPNPFFAQRGSVAVADEPTRRSESSVNSTAAAWTRRIRPKKDEPQVKIVEGENDFPFGSVESLRIGSAHAAARPDQEDRIEALLNTLVESINRRTVTSPESQPVRRDYR
jgi:type IV secretory pathway TraG/TraD family ATPase VirD4